MAWKKLLTCTAVAVSLLTAPAFIQNAGAQKMRKVNFRLAWIPSGQYCYALVASKLGFWRKLGLDVQIHRGYGSGRTSKDIATGQFDVGEASFGPVALTVSKGGSLIAMGARYQKSPIGAAALKEKGMKTPKDLEGMTLASTVGSGSYVLFPAFAKSAGFDAKKVKWQLISPGAYLPSLLAKKVDAVSTYIVSFGPGLMARGIDYDFIFYADYGLEMLDQVFIAQPSRLKKDRDLYRKFVQGALKGVAYSFLKPEESIAITMKELPIYGKGKMSRKIIEAGLGVASAISVSPFVEKHGIGWMEPSLVNDSVDKIVRYMGAAPIKDIKGLYTNEFIGTEKLTPAQWKKVRVWSRRFLPSS